MKRSGILGRRFNLGPEPASAGGRVWAEHDFTGLLKNFPGGPFVLGTLYRPLTNSRDTCLVTGHDFSRAAKTFLFDFGEADGSPTSRQILEPVQACSLCALDPTRKHGYL